MLKNVSDINSKKQTGLNTQDNILDIDKSQSPDMMDVIVHFDGSLEKRLGSDTRNSVILTNSAGSGFSPAGTLTGSLIAYYKFDEAAGQRNDSFGGNHFDQGKFPASTGGIKNKAAELVASNSEYLLINNTSTLATGDTNFTISTWFYLNSTGNYALVSKSDADKPDASVSLLLHMSGGNGATTLFDSSSTNHSLTLTGSAQIQTDNSKFFGSSLRTYKAVSSCVFAGTSDEFNFADGEFAVEFFVNLSSHRVVTPFISYGGTLTNRSWAIDHNSDSGTVRFISYSNNAISQINSGPFNFSLNTFYHVAVTRSDSTINIFIDGSSVLTTTDATVMQNNSLGLLVACSSDGDSIQRVLDGWMDEVRITKGAPVYLADFTAPTRPFGRREFEYVLFVRSDNNVVWQVSSNGWTATGELTASSFGTVSTATWYNATAYHDATNNSMGLVINGTKSAISYSSGVREGSAPFVVGAISNGAEKLLDARIDETGFWKTVLSDSDVTNFYNAGCGNTINVAFDNKPWSSFDFGASALRWLVASAGTGVYASSDLGVAWVVIATDRSANYQYFERSKNVLIATSDSYDTPLAWPGSAGTYMVVVNSNAPACKYSINFQGYLILLNSQLRKRGFFYEDENTQLSGTWASSFDIPSSQDDEITSAFILRRYLYVSTRYYLYRVSYVGGNPDFSYLKVKDWGYVARTVKPFYLENVGQIVAGLCWDGKMRLFDGSDDQIFSGNIEQDNGISDFALNNLSFSGSALTISFAETDYNSNVYKLCVAIGKDSMQTTHMINYDGRSKAFYPYQRQFFNTMTMAESGNRRYLMAFDRSGYCHLMDSGNLDGNTTPINEHYDSNLIFDKAPAQVQKGHQTHLFFSNETAGRIYYLDRTDFSDTYKINRSFVISGSERKLQHHEVIDVPESYNVYQWRITSSSGTGNPWKLQRYDHLNEGLGIGKEQ